MKIIVTTEKDFKTMIERHEALLSCRANNSEYGYFSSREKGTEIRFNGEDKNKDVIGYTDLPVGVYQEGTV